MALRRLAFKPVAKQGRALNAEAILRELESLGSESYRKVLRNHGAREPLFGVKISELQKIRKRIKRDHELALNLYATGNYDAMYLAGLIADDAKMTKQDLRRWVKEAYCHGLAEYTVAWVAAESRHGWELALEWIDSKDEQAAAAGWATLCALVSLRDDADLDMARLGALLRRVEETIHEQPNRVRYQMNAFVISLGSYVKAFTEDAIAAGRAIGDVLVDMGKTACKVPDAAGYIEKVIARGALGKKRKTVKC
jgi:3-methyladenine DNA glycosylase AlkD